MKSAVTAPEGPWLCDPLVPSFLFDFAVEGLARLEFLKSALVVNAATPGFDPGLSGPGEPCRI